MLGIKEYPTPSVIGMYNRLLSAPFPLVLTQSFAFLSRAAGQALLQRQFYRMANAGDFALIRTLGFEPRVEHLIEPCQGVIRWAGGDARREP